MFKGETEDQDGDDHDGRGEIDDDETGFWLEGAVMAAGVDAGEDVVEPVAEEGTEEGADDGGEAEHA